jgi:protein-tyrosine phosphatase
MTVLKNRKLRCLGRVLATIVLIATTPVYANPALSDEALIGTHLIPLEGGRNFRDIGGISTTDGATIKRGMLYRAGVLHHLTAEDYAKIDTFGIRTVIDFRDAEERQNEPTTWLAGEVEILDWDYTMSFGDDIDLNEMLRMMAASEAGAESMMAALYRTMVEQQKPHYQAMFQELLAPSGPVLFHCTAGKDRTGVAAALIQTALGVDRETVIRDYTLSEIILNLPEQQNSLASMTAHNDGNYSMLAMLPEASVNALMGTRRIYIETAFDEMTQNYGSVDAYIREALGVSEQDLATLRALYLE